MRRLPQAEERTGRRCTIRDLAHVQYLDVSPHHRRMIETVWELGGLDQYEPLNLRRWAHMLGFRGHFMTKSQRYSTTFQTLRTDRRVWRLREDLAALDRNTDDPNGIPVDLAAITVVNDWVPVHFGRRDDGERESAAAIAERHHQQRRSQIERRRAA